MKCLHKQSKKKSSTEHPQTAEVLTEAALEKTLKARAVPTAVQEEPVVAAAQNIASDDIAQPLEIAEISTPDAQPQLSATDSEPNNTPVTPEISEETAFSQVIPPATPETTLSSVADTAPKDDIIWNTQPTAANETTPTDEIANSTPQDATTTETEVFPETSLAQAHVTAEAPIQEPVMLAEISPTAPAEADKAIEPLPLPDDSIELVSVEANASVPPLSLQEDKTPLVSAQDLATATKALQDIRIWEGKKGHSLKRLLTNWCEDSKIELIWNADESYDLSQNVIISGTLETALNVTFSQAVKRPPSYKITKDGLPKLIIE